MVNSCRECGPCRQGEEQYCTQGHILTYGSVDRDGTLTQGGYSTHVVVDQDFVLRIPQGIGLDTAAPLLCAGVTTYSPLTRWGAGPGKIVGVIGLGGLGHVAVKLAKAMGAEVTVLSRTLAKQDDGLGLGADHYYATSDPATFEHLASTFDLIVNTVSAELDIDAYLSLLAVNGTLAIVGATPRFSLDRFSLVRNQRAFAGSQIGGIPITQQMLDFCAEHGIGAEVEVIPAEHVGVHVNVALARFS